MWPLSEEPKYCMHRRLWEKIDSVLKDSSTSSSSIPVKLKVFDLSFDWNFVTWYPKKFLERSPTQPKKGGERKPFGYLTSKVDPSQQQANRICVWKIAKWLLRTDSPFTELYSLTWFTFEDFLHLLPKMQVIRLSVFTRNKVVEFGNNIPEKKTTKRFDRPQRTAALLVGRANYQRRTCS